MSRENCGLAGVQLIHVAKYALLLSEVTLQDQGLQLSQGMSFEVTAYSVSHNRRWQHAPQYCCVQLGWLASVVKGSCTCKRTAP